MTQNTHTHTHSHMSKIHTFFFFLLKDIRLKNSLQSVTGPQNLGNCGYFRILCSPGLLGLSKCLLCPLWMTGTKERSHSKFPRPEGGDSPCLGEA